MRKSVTMKSVLTKRQQEVLALLIKGETEANIASILGISVQMVYRHVAGVKKKTNTRSTAAAVYTATKAGWV